MATGRSDYPNQINNVLGFPYIFRGALDVRATEITEGMKMAAPRLSQNLQRSQFQTMFFRPTVESRCISDPNS